MGRIKKVKKRRYISEELASTTTGEIFSNSSGKLYEEEYTDEGEINYKEYV